MAAILVVCTGNVCRSPIAEAFLRRALEARFGASAPSVASAGTAGWEGSGPVPESVRAAAERGVDVSSHVARRLTAPEVGAADLVVAMAAEHRGSVARLAPGAEPKTFTLKELVRLVESLPPARLGTGIAVRVTAADELRRKGFEGDPADEDVTDPLGMPFESFRAVAWELDEWCSRLADGLVGRAPARAGAAGG